MRRASEDHVEIRQDAPVSDEQLNGLFFASWPDHKERSFRPAIAASLAYICAFQETRLVGYVNVAWDGCTHAFILDPTVHADFRRRGIGQRLVLQAVEAAGERGVTWVHVDFEPSLRDFYAKCGFRATEAGVIHVAK